VEIVCFPKTVEVVSSLHTAHDRVGKAFGYFWGIPFLESLGGHVEVFEIVQAPVPGLDNEVDEYSDVEESSTAVLCARTRLGPVVDGSS
jgi:hypothetical protein